MTKQWEDHRHIIIREYKDNNKPLHEVKKFMEERYRFKASIRAYRSRFDRWRVRKYTCRKRRDSFAAESDKSVLSGSSDDGTGSPPSPPRSPIHRRVSSSPQEHSSIHYTSSDMYESTTPTEDFFSPSGLPIFEPPRQMYPTDPLAGLLPGSGLHSSQGGLVDNFRYPADHQGQCATGIYRLVHDPGFPTKFIKACSQPLLGHCFPDRVANRFPRPYSNPTGIMARRPLSNPA